MAYEKECDEVLKFLCNQLEIAEIQIDLSLPQETLHTKLSNENKVDSTIRQFNTIINILFANKHIQFYREPKYDVLTENLCITREGIIFINTNSYVERKIGWDLEKRMKEQQIALNSIEIFLKRKTFYIAVLGIIISLISLYYSHQHQDTNNDTNYPSNNTHISNPVINK